MQTFSGVAIGAYGCVLDSGSFNVFEVIYPGLPDPVSQLIAIIDDTYVLLVSGLSFGSLNSEKVNLMILNEMLCDWICGFLGTSEVKIKSLLVLN